MSIATCTSRKGLLAYNFVCLIFCFPFANCCGLNHKMNRAEAFGRAPSREDARYDRTKYAESLQKYSESVSTFSWLLSGPSGYFVVEPTQAAAEPSLWVFISSTNIICYNPAFFWHDFLHSLDLCLFLIYCFVVGGLLQVLRSLILTGMAFRCRVVKTAPHLTGHTIFSRLGIKYHGATCVQGSICVRIYTAAMIAGYIERASSCTAWLFLLPHA